MIIISTYIEKSNIEGLGLFAGQDINEGDIIWFLDPMVDHVFCEEDFETLVSIMDISNSDRFKRWSYKRGNNYILCADNTKFANHSENPNCKSLGQYDVALKDIKKGEELTYDYRFIDDELKDKRGKIYEQISKTTEGTEGYKESRETDGETQD